MLIKLLFVIAVLLSQSCINTSNVVNADDVQVRHPNGLTLIVPNDYEAKQTESGFKVEPKNNKNSGLRFLAIIYVNLSKDETIPEPQFIQSKTVGNQEIRYKIEKSESGSGGTEYDLTAYKKIGGKIIQFSQTAQSEHYEPNFAICWKIVEQARFKAS